MINVKDSKHKWPATLVVFSSAAGLILF